MPKKAKNILETQAETPFEEKICDDVYGKYSEMETQMKHGTGMMFAGWMQRAKNNLNEQNKKVHEATQQREADRLVIERIRRICKTWTDKLL